MKSPVMATHLTLDLVQTFARELGSQDDFDAICSGYASAELGYKSLLANSQQAYAVIALEHRGPRVLGVIGVTWTGELWLHTAECFKAAGLGALRVARKVFRGLLEHHAQLFIDVDASNGALVRMADWLGFRHVGFVEKAGRPWHHCVVRRAV